MRQYHGIDKPLRAWHHFSVLAYLHWDGIVPEIVISSEEEAWKIIERNIKKDGIIFNEDVTVRFVGWPIFDVYIKKTKVSGSITPTMMESFISLQRSIYHTVTYAQHGDTDLRRLDDNDRDRYEIYVRVEEGSSDQSVDLSGILTELGSEFIKSMPPEYVVGTILSAGLLWAGVASWRYYLDTRKEIRIAEINNSEKQAALNTMQFSSEQETKRMEMLTAALAKQQMGQRIISSGESVHDALLKSASNINDPTILGQTISTGNAQELRSFSRRKANTRIVEQELRVLDVNTSDNNAINIVFSDPFSDETYKSIINDAVLADASKKALFSALENRSTVWVRMRNKEVEGEVRSTEIIKVVDVDGSNAAE